MLHLIFQSPIELSVLQRIAKEDDVVCLENTVFRLNKDSVISNELQRMLSNKIHLYVLGDELETRGIQVDELINGIEIIDYSDLVKLTEKNKVTRTWC